jgi:carbon starvation protein
MGEDLEKRRRGDWETEFGTPSLLVPVSRSPGLPVSRSPSLQVSKSPSLPNFFHSWHSCYSWTSPSPMRKIAFLLLWLLVAVAGAFAYYTIATQRQEPLNSGYILVAALCTYAIGYRFYSKWIAARLLAVDDRRATPCEAHEDGKDFVKTNKWIVFGHHFAAISGPGPLVGPVLAAQFGYLPGTLWILIGVVLGGAVQDLVILFASMRRDGKSLGQMLKEELNGAIGAIGLVAILSIMTILLAVLALVVVNALAESPWGVFTVGATIPIAMLMGGYLRFIRVGKVLEISVLGVGLLLLAVWGGQFVHQHPEWSRAFHVGAEPLAWSIIIYAFAASILPVWLLLAPRDYLSTFMKLGTIFALVVGVFFVLPDLKMPAMSKFVDGSGLVVPGKLFPFCFITIACGAISGFHTLISSGITPKIITRESYARPIGYGAMLLESLVAIVAMIAACTLDPGVYLAMNVKGTGPNQAAIAQDIKTKVEASGLTEFVRDPARGGAAALVPVTVSVAEMDQLAKDMGEHTLFGRTGGAATLAVGMAQIFSRMTQGRWLDLWYHFAMMFEALFILTTLDAGTRVGRYLIQDALGQLWKPLGDIRSLPATLLASVLVVVAWGSFLIMGVRDPEGGVKALWPIFGIANQMLAAVAMCLATTIVLKTLLQRGASTVGGFAPVLVTLVPLMALLAITFTAAGQKVMHPKLSFFVAAASNQQKLPALEAAAASARTAGDPAAIAASEAALKNTRTLVFNNRVDGTVTMGFLVLISLVLVLTVWEWWRLLARLRPSELRETEPIWLAESALAGTPRPATAYGIAALGFAFLRHLSGQDALDREAQATAQCDCAKLPTQRARQNVFLAVTERRFRGVNRCC